MSTFLEVDNLLCQYDENIILEGLGFHLGKAEIASLLGPSGCGKSTLLRAIAGFETPKKGSIAINGKVLSDKNTNIAPEKRKIGMVFQDYALFPHFTIHQNIAYGLSKKQRVGSDDRIDRLLKLVDLSGFNQRYPHELSGGQQQRVALARALAPEPELILLDEPFSNLDADLRTRLGIQVREILKSLEISAILVTHDQQEAFAMADHIGLINQGNIIQWGTPYDLYHEPSSRFVAQFIGRGSFLKGISESHERFNTEIGSIEGNRCYAWQEGTPVDILIRPDDVMYSEHSQTTATISSKTFAGTATHYVLALESGTKIEAAFPSHQDFKIGEVIGFDLDTEHLIAFK